MEASKAQIWAVEPQKKKIRYLRGKGGGAEKTTSIYSHGFWCPSTFRIQATSRTNNELFT
jgi:hypothetical protein